MLRYFRIKLFPNKTTLFYRSQLHVPLYVRDRGWGSRYRGLGILTSTPDFCFWNYKNFSYVSKKCSDIFESNCFLKSLLYCFLKSLLYCIGKKCSYMSQLHVPLYGRNRGWGSRYCGLGILMPTQFFYFEIRNVVICQRRTQIILGDIFSSIVLSITTLFYQSQ